MQFNTPKREWSLVSKLHNLLQKFSTYLADVFFEDSQISVSTSLDAQNNLQWHVYNDRTNRTATFKNEAEVIEWIEQSYNPVSNANKNFWFFPRSSTLKVLND